MQNLHHVDPTSFFPAPTQLGIVPTTKLALSNKFAEALEMSEEESWRSEAAYDYIDQLTTSDLAWEFLRRNPDYRIAFQELLSSGRLNDETATSFAEQWGLCFRSRPTHHGSRPADLLDTANRSGGDHPPNRPGSGRRIAPYR
jgi:hypothetical protein